MVFAVFNSRCREGRWKSKNFSQRLRSRLKKSNMKSLSNFSRLIRTAPVLSCTKRSINITRHGAPPVKKYPWSKFTIPNQFQTSLWTSPPHCSIVLLPSLSPLCVVFWCRNIRNQIISLSYYKLKLRLGLVIKVLRIALAVATHMPPIFSFIKVRPLYILFRDLWVFFDTLMVCLSVLYMLFL